MPSLTRTALIARPPEVVFAIVNDIASYPRFVPGCSAAEVLMHNEHEVVARITVHRGPLSTCLTTRNVLTPHSELRLQLVEGPLRALEGVWTFTPVGSNGCRIDLNLSFEFSNPLKAALLGPLLDSTATSMVQAFVARAQSGHA